SRPKHFFREEGVMPETVELSFARPREYDHLSAREFGALVTDRIRQVEESTAVERRRTGTTVVGRKAILCQAWRDRPVSREPRRGLVPRIAARNKWSRIEALRRNRSFVDAYIAARARFIDGMRDVLFPAGTYWLRRFARALCVPHPSPS